MLLKTYLNNIIDRRQKLKFACIIVDLIIYNSFNTDLHIIV